MKIILVVFTILFTTQLLKAEDAARKPSQAAGNITSTCGFNKKDGEKIRLEIVLNQEDEFSATKVVTINGQKPARLSDSGASGFGPKGYEHITLKLNGCDGTASYSHFNSGMPMNPMEDLDLKCVCKK